MITVAQAAGSRCVVSKNSEHYIDARMDVRHPGMSFIELVHNGQVRKRLTVDDAVAPEAIVELMRWELK
jgi:hypothetical protein